MAKLDQLTGSEHMDAVPSAPGPDPAFRSTAVPLRTVNVHQAKTHLSRLIDDAHAGETILLAKAGKPWARLMPLAPPSPQRIPGRLRSRGPLSQPDGLLEPLEPEELAAWENSPLTPGMPQP